MALLLNKILVLTIVIFNTASSQYWNEEAIRGRSFLPTFVGRRRYEGSYEIFGEDSGSYRTDYNKIPRIKPYASDVLHSPFTGRSLFGRPRQGYSLFGEDSWSYRNDYNKKPRIKPYAIDVLHPPFTGRSLSGRNWEVGGDRIRKPYADDVLNPPYWYAPGDPRKPRRQWILF